MRSGCPGVFLGVTFVLIPGAGGSAWYWHRVVDELERRGLAALAVDLPADDDRAGWTEYADAVVAAADGVPEPVLVGQSMGGFTAPLAATHLPAQMIVLVNAMIPRPGETGGAWWDATGQPAARAELAARQGRQVTGEIDVMADFFHDVPDAVVAEATRRAEPAQSVTPFTQPWPLPRWPELPTRIIAGQDDRLFPVEFQRRVARERLGLPVEEVPGGHLVALSRPVELADRLESYVRVPA
jgi:pimeloyl-ACP methyl ester carboxylesterase